MGARENGEIMFTKMGEGTLMSYNNATEPFGYKRLKKLLPSGTLTKLYLWMGTIASDYYKRTVEGFLEVSKGLSREEIRQDVARMLEQPGL